MTTKPFFRILSLTTILVLAACSTGLHIFDTGYSAIDVGEGRWAVKFDSTEVRSDAEAEANLMVHTARWAIDHNATHFSVYELVIGNETKFRTDSDTWINPRATSTESGTATSTTDETKSSRLTTTREGRFTARANIRLWKGHPEKIEGELYDASKVLDKYRGLRGKTTTSRITVQEHSTN